MVQIMESIVPGDSCTAEIRSQRRTCCSMCSTVKDSTLISATQFWPSRASRTIRFFLLEALKIKGAKSFGGVPSNQEEDQKGSLGTVANGDPGSGVEKVSVGDIVWGFRSYPRFFWRR